MANCRTLTSYQNKHLLGEGYQAQTYLAVDNDTQEHIALKIFKDECKNLFVNNELTFYRNVGDHPNIVQPRYLDPESQFIAMEYAEKGDLFSLLAQGGKLPLPIARALFLQLIDAIEHIHQAGFYHGDIKPENVLLSKDMQVKLCDFGFSGRESVVLKGRKGSPGYIAPEIWESEAYSGYIADTFSAVVVFYIMVTGKPPFANTKKDNPHYFPRRQNKYDLFWQYQRNVDLSHALKDLFWVSFSKSPGERYTIKDLRMHPAIAGQPIATQEEILRYV